jgi:hypothetical protein
VVLNAGGVLEKRKKFLHRNLTRKFLLFCKKYVFSSNKKRLFRQKSAPAAGVSAHARERIA